MAIFYLILVCSVLSLIAIIISKWKWYGPNDGDGGQQELEGGDDGDPPPPKFPTIFPTGPTIINERPATEKEINTFTEAVSSDRFLEPKEHPNQ